MAAILLDDIRRVTHFARQNEMLFAQHISQKHSKESRLEMIQLQKELGAMEKRQTELKSAATNIVRFLENARKYTEIKELTSEILRTFIQRVEIGERSKKYSRNAIQEVRIYYCDIGLLDDIPEADKSEPTLTENGSEEVAWKMQRRLCCHSLPAENSLHFLVLPQSFPMGSKRSLPLSYLVAGITP